MGTKHSMSPNSSCLIKLHSSHHPFVSSCGTTNLSSTSSPMQTTNHPLITPLNLTNHTPPINVPYQPPTFHVIKGSQPYIFPNPLDHAQIGHLDFPTLLIHTVSLHHTPTHLQPPPKVLCPTYACQFIN
jgi:hypothetical protein